jgi:hypothetical protein
MKRVISLGAGVQSSALLLMAGDGRFGAFSRPESAVFADPGWESEETYDWLAWLEQVSAIPIVRVSIGKNIKDEAIYGGPRVRHDGRRFVTMPFFLLNPDGTSGIGRRQCTKEYKLQPLMKHLRLMGASAKCPIECWIGISTDEAHRMKPSRVKYIVNRYPLIEAGLSREDCQNYLMGRTGKKAPKSSCIGCPFHGDQYWANLRATSPDEFEDACKFDDAIRRFPGMKVDQFLHRSLVPLRQIKEFAHEKQGRMFEDAFGNECEGMCGL